MSFPLMPPDNLPIAPDSVSREDAKQASRFLAWFLIVATVGFTIYYFPYDEVGVRMDGVFEAYLGGYARMAGAVLGVFDHAVSVSGTTIHGRFSMHIVRSCDAMEANILFLSAMLAFPATWLRKMIALAGGLITLVACNITRLICLYFIGIHAHAQFEFAHYEAWPLAMITFATIDFVVCARWMARPVNRVSPVASGPNLDAPA